MSNWRGRYLGGKTAHDEFGAILSDIRHFGKTTPNDRKRLRDLARSIGWNEPTVDSEITDFDANRRSNRVRKVWN